MSLTYWSLKTLPICALPTSRQGILSTCFALVFLIPTHESFKMLKLGLQSWSMLNLQELQGSSCTVSTSWVFICKGIGTAAGLNKHLDQSQINYLVRHWSESKPVSLSQNKHPKLKCLGDWFFKEVNRKMLETCSCHDWEQAEEGARMNKSALRDLLSSSWAKKWNGKTIIEREACILQKYRWISVSLLLTHPLFFQRVQIMDYFYSLAEKVFARLGSVYNCKKKSEKEQVKLLFSSLWFALECNSFSHLKKKLSTQFCRL